MPRDIFDPNQLVRLTEAFRQIGIDDPGSLAQAELSRAVPRLVLAADDKPDHPIRLLVDLILLFSLRDRATEVGFEPGADGCRLHYRIDGTAYDMVSPPLIVARRIGQVLKVMADLDICNSRTRQTGRVRVQVGDGVADLNVTVVPTEFGESVFVTVVGSSVTTEDAAHVMIEWGFGGDGYIEFEVQGDAEIE
jgi:type II secretory ATPase GspE/PulE/Tfp pilus assembly ATPase PilB-like protein